MKRFVIGLIIVLFLANCGVASARKISTPPPFTKINPNLQHWLYDVYNNFQILTVTDTAPNGSRNGRKGEIIIYDNAGTFELWVNTTSSTVWQKIGP